jgi:hypothetical protein
MDEYRRVRILDTFNSVARSFLLAALATAILSSPVIAMFWLTQERTTEMRLEMCESRVRELQTESVERDLGLEECWTDLRRLSRQSLEK